MIEYTEYLDTLKNKSPKTLLLYKRYLDIFIEKFKINSPKEIEKLERKQLASFRDSINGSESTKNLIKRILKAFFNFLYENDYIKNTNNIDRLDTLTEPQVVKRFLTEDEKILLINSAKYSDVKAMIALLIFHGLRRGEAVNLKRVDYNGKYLHINRKRQHQDRIKLHPIVKQLLDIYLQKRKDDCEYLFVAHRSKDGKVHGITGESVRVQVKTTCERAGIDPSDIHPHTLRHTFASTLLNDGHSTIVVRDLMGHSSATTTERYAHTQKTYLDSIVASQKSEGINI